MNRPRAIFFGTPAFAVPCLDALAHHADVVAVVTQPDKPQGRGLELHPTPVKARALELGITNIMQPVKVRVPEFAASLAALNADLAVVVAYGRILVPAVLNAPRLGCVNVHASILPRHRGAAPIQWAVLNGDVETGVCLMQMDEGLDTGPVLACEKTPIFPDETSGELFERLSRLGADVLLRELPNVFAQKLIAVPQDHARATHAPMLEKNLGRIDWSKDAEQLHNLVRGASPWPGAFTQLSGKTLKVHKARIADANAQGAAGAVTRAGKDGIVVQTGRGTLALLEVQLEGKRRMTAAEFLAGHPLAEGAVLV